MHSIILRYSSHSHWSTTHTLSKKEIVLKRHAFTETEYQVRHDMSASSNINYYNHNNKDDKVLKLL